MTVHGSYSADGTTGIGVALADIRAEKVQFIPHGTGLLFPRVGGFENQSLKRVLCRSKRQRREIVSRHQQLKLFDRTLAVTTRQ
ncbi:MAG: hypothetical protein JJ979_19875 [Roseibium sp.]|nr:hypothetical protein [Roseibium sp.]